MRRWLAAAGLLVTVATPLAPPAAAAAAPRPVFVLSGARTASADVTVGRGVQLSYGVSVATDGAYAGYVIYALPSMRIVQYEIALPKEGVVVGGTENSGYIGMGGPRRSWSAPVSAGRQDSRAEAPADGDSPLERPRALAPGRYRLALITSGAATVNVMGTAPRAVRTTPKAPFVVAVGAVELAPLAAGPVLVGRVPLAVTAYRLAVQVMTQTFTSVGVSYANQCVVVRAGWCETDRDFGPAPPEVFPGPPGASTGVYVSYYGPGFIPPGARDAVFEQAAPAPDLRGIGFALVLP